MEEVKGVIGIVGQWKIYPEPVAPISVVGLTKGQDFLIENAVPIAALRFPLVFNGVQSESFLLLSERTTQ